MCGLVCERVCWILWHVKEIEFHKEIWSLIRLFISMQGSGLNLSVIYDSLRHVLSLPTSPSNSSFSPQLHPSILPLLSPPHTYPPPLPCQIPSSQKTPNSAAYQSNASSLPLLTLAELKLIHVYLCIHHCYTPIRSFTGALKQFVIFTSTKQDITLIQGITLDQEEALMLCSCCRCNGPRRVVPGLVSNCTDGLCWPLIRI